MPLFIISLLLLSLASNGVAQTTGLPVAGITPDSPFYFLEIISERIGTLFTFGELKKAERYAFLASERIAEAKAVAEKGKVGAVQKALQRYENQLNKSLARAEKARVKKKSIASISERLAEATGKHLMVLEEVLDKVPEAAKSAVEKAREVSMNGQESALRALARENPERAIEINLQAIERRLKLAEEKAEKGEINKTKQATKEFERLNNLGRGILQIAQGLGKDTTTVEQLVTKATSFHLEVLAEVYEKVPEEAKPTILEVMEFSIERHKETAESLKEKKIPEEEIPRLFLPDHCPHCEEIIEEIRKLKGETGEPQAPGFPPGPPTPGPILAPQ